MCKYIYIIACLSLAYSTAINPKTDYNYDLKKQQTHMGTMSKKEVIILEKKTYTNRECNDLWISDGYCDDINNTEECSWDGGDCCGSTCINNTFDCGADADWAACNSECLDPNPNANDDCCVENDCPFTCAGNGLIECWDGSCAETENDCPIETCGDTDCSLYLNNYTCPEIENNFGYDCSLCEEEGLCPVTCEEEGLITCPNGSCSDSLDECNSCENPDEAMFGTNTSTGHDQYYYFNTIDGGFLTLSTAGSGAGPDGDVDDTADNIDTRLFLYSICEDVDLEYPYGNYIAENDDWGSSQYGECPNCVWLRESYINIAIPAGEYLIISSDQYNQGNTPFEWTLEFNIGVEGCTNPFSDNYDPEANIDDGSCQFSDEVFFISCDGGGYPSETSWDLVEENSQQTILSGGSPYETTATLNPGNYYIHAYDTFGDGWNNDVWQIVGVDENEIFSYTLQDGSEGVSRSFTIEQNSCLGDVNSDNIINISDVVVIINAIINGTTEDLVNCADLNEDGVVNVSDLVLIIDIILNI